MNNHYLSSVNKEFDHQMIKFLLTQAKEFNVPIISDEGINLLIQLIKISSSKKILEIGTAIGYSSILMALFSDAIITTIERDEKMVVLAKNNIKKANLTSRVTLIQGDGRDISLEDNDYDILFIDAAKAAYIDLFEKFSKNVKTGGIIICDNLLFKGQVENPDIIESRNRRQLVKKIDKFNQYLVNNSNFNTYIYGIGDGISISIKK
ncbi:MAG: O-methyltransferase [Candidatus Izimaplasma sp.]|nr:O-methyltransferase [Candidatus Izimaplasma bacterium]